jgi:hypothetical protein
LDARYALTSSGQPDDELPPEASKLQDKDDIIDFLSKLSSMNMLQRSVLSDLKDENIY